MTTWFTADLHLGHRNINSYCGRPFDDAEAMNHSLVDGWNGLVPDQDDVWVLGDFALGKLADTLPLVSELRGRKVLLAGNHDRCWIGHGRRAVGWTERYLDAGFDDVHGVSSRTASGAPRCCCATSRTGATATTTTGTASIDPLTGVRGCSTVPCTSAGPNAAA